MKRFITTVIITCIVNRTNANLAFGKCPVIPPDKSFNCTKMCYKDNGMLIPQAFVPAAPEFKQMSMFAYNFTSINNHQIKMSCENLLIEDIDMFFSVFRAGGSDVEIIKFLVKDGEAYILFLNKDKMESCRKWFDGPYPNHQYTLRYKPDAYLLIWGCAQIDEFVHDWAFWLLSKSNDMDTMSISHGSMNVSQLILNMMLKDTGLGKLVGLKDEILVRDDLTSVLAVDDTFYFSDCYANRGVNVRSVVNIAPVLVHMSVLKVQCDTSKDQKFIAVLITVVLVLVGSGFVFVFILVYLC